MRNSPIAPPCSRYNDSSRNDANSAKCTRLAATNRWAATLRVVSKCWVKCSEEGQALRAKERRGQGKGEGKGKKRARDVKGRDREIDREGNERVIDRKGM